MELGASVWSCPVTGVFWKKNADSFCWIRGFTNLNEHFCCTFLLGHVFFFNSTGLGRSVSNQFFQLYHHPTTKPHHEFHPSHPPMVVLKKRQNASSVSKRHWPWATSRAKSFTVKHPGRHGHTPTVIVPEGHGYIYLREWLIFVVN